MSDLKAGDRVYLFGNHSWADHMGTLVAEEIYGPLFCRKTGWRIKLDNGSSCYAKPSDFSKVAISLTNKLKEGHSKQ